MGFFSDVISNTTGSVKAAVSNTASSVQSVATHPIDTFINSPVINNPLANPGASLFGAATGISPAKQYVIGAAGGTAVVAGSAIAGAGWHLPGALGALATPGLSALKPATPAQTLVPQQQPTPTQNLPVAPIAGISLLALLLFVL